MHFFELAPRMGPAVGQLDGSGVPARFGQRVVASVAIPL